jgi:ABC-type multidrug transport system fused ATPase/permease subunit
MRARLSLWREYAGYFRSHTVALTAITLTGLAQSFAYIPLAMLLRWIFDDILVSRRRGDLWIAIAGLLAVQIGSLAMAYWIRVQALRVNHDVLAELRRKSLERLYRFPRSFYVAADLDRLHVTLVYDTAWIDAMNSALTAQFLPSGLSALALFTILFWINPKYAVITALAAPVIFVGNRLMTRHAWFRQEALRRAFENFSRGARFAISAMELTRAQAAEPMELRRQAANIEELRHVALDLNRFDAAQQLIQGAVLLAAVLLVLIAGGSALADGAVTRGQVMGFYVAAGLFATQVRAMVAAIPEIRMGMRAFRELDYILTNPDREPYQGTRQISKIGELRVERVTFAYPNGPPILREVTLVIPAGERVALIGANGSGKSSLIHLIAGDYRPTSGGLVAGGVGYEELDIRGLRGRMSVVPQNPFLFAGTIRENVIYGSENVSEEAIQEALAAAGADGFVGDISTGLDTVIGEHGVRLSGGQRQRLVIARALLRKPELLILDEPTNHLDQEAIEQMMENLRGLPFRPSVLVISHEWRVLRHVDRAYRLNDGKLEAVALPAEQEFSQSTRPA